MLMQTTDTCHFDMSPKKIDSYLNKSRKLRFFQSLLQSFHFLIYLFYLFIHQFCDEITVSDKNTYHKGITVNQICKQAVYIKKTNHNVCGCIKVMAHIGKMLQVQI